MGRPPLWDNPEAFEKAVDQYFTEEKNPTWTGLAIHLGFSSRDGLSYYHKEKPEFLHPIKKALLRIERKYENGLAERNPAGSIFALKNFGWKDKQEINTVIDDKRKDLSKLSDDDLATLETIYSKIGES